MSNDIRTLYPGRVNPADADYPFGSIKNESVPGTNDGTPLTAEWGNDFEALKQAALDGAGMSPNGITDTAAASQIYDALNTVHVRRFNNVSSMIASNQLKIGQIVTSGTTLWKVISVPVNDISDFIPLNPICIIDFGGDPTGQTLSNDALNDALDSISATRRKNAVYFPAGKYRIENFTRRVQAPNVNVRQEVVMFFGDESPATVAHQYMVTPTIIEGDGDLFLDVVNYRVKNIGFRNRLNGSGEPIVSGKLFTLLALGGESGTFDDCYFGESDYHFYHDDTPTPDPVNDYMLNLRYINCSFFHAKIRSRHLNGYTAGYTEERCYTAHNNAGLFMTQPGPSAAINGSTFEYNNDHAIELDCYGFAINYGLFARDTFFESNGGLLASIPGLTVDPLNRPIAYPPIALKTQEANAARCVFEWENCHTTYVGSNPPIAYVYLPDQRYVVLSRGNKFSYTPANIYSASETTYVNPEPANTIIRLAEGNDEIAALPSQITLGGTSANGAISTRFGASTQQWLENHIGDESHSVYVAVGASGRVGADSTNGTFLQSGPTKIVAVTNAGGGKAKLLVNGAGWEFISPDGLTKKVLSIDNSGNPVWS